MLYHVISITNGNASVAEQVHYFLDNSCKFEFKSI